MNNDTKTKAQLIRELEILSSQVKQLEQEAIQYKKAEAGRKKRREKHTSLLDSMSSIIWYIDRQGIIMRANKTAVEGRGVPARDIIGKSLYDLFPPDEAARLVADNREVIDSEKAKLGIIESTTLPTGEKVWGETDKIPYYDEEGEVAGVMIIGQSITERKRAEERFVEANERWERTFDAVPDLIAILDNNHRILQINKAMATRLGLTAEACMGQFCYEAVHGMEKPPVFCPHQQLLKDGFEHLADVHEDRLGGHFLVTTSPLSDREGNIIGSVHIARDVTEAKKTEAILRANQVQLSEAMELARVVYWDLERDTDTFIFNDAFYALYGTTAEAEGGYRMTRDEYMKRFVHPDDVARVIKGREESRPGPQSGLIAELDHRIIRRDGMVRNLFTRTRIVRDEKGDFVRLYGSNQDITERKEAEQALLTSQMQLAEAAHMARLAYWEIDILTGIFTFNDAFYELIGTTAQREGGYTVAIKDYFTKYSHPDDLPGINHFIEKIRTHTDTDQSWEMESRIIRSDGEVRHITTRLRVIRDPHGQPARIFGINQDITERKEIEEALRRSEELYKMVAENASDMIWVEDIQTHKITYVSPSVFRLTGYTPEESVALPMEIKLTPESVAASIEHNARAREALSRGQQIDDEVLELEHKCKDGSTIWMETVVRGLYDTSGILVAVHGVSRDITKRKHAEDALRTSRLQLAEAMDLARIVHWEADWDTRIFTFNDPFYALLGTTANLEGGYMMSAREYVKRFVHPDDVAVVAQSAEVNRSGTERELVRDVEHRVVRRDGEVRHILVRTRAFRDDEGHIVRFYGTNQDITERKLAETELARMNRALRMLGSSNQTLIHVTDEATLLNGVCQVAVEEGGYLMAWVGFAETDEAKTIRPVAHAGLDSGYIESRAFSWDDSDRGQGPGGISIRTKKPCIIHDISKEPTFAPWREEAMKRGFRSVIALPLVDEDQVFGTLGIYAGEVDAFDAQEVEILNELAGDLAFGIIALRTRNEHQRDQEERIKLESQLHQAQKMQAIGQLAGGVAHDFNNILTVIIGYGSLIKIALDNKAPINPQHADQILIAGRKAADLTQSLLAFSRKQQITLEPRSLSDIVITTGKLLGRLLTEDIELIISPSPEDPTIMADATQIDQVLINLAANARDAMPSGGRLTIETSLAKIDDDFVKSHGFGLQGNYALLSISDTGIGMDDETKSHIFEPFFTTKEAGKGTGLGLATVYGIVKQHNGYIVVDSEPDSGTAFRIYFPLADRKYAAETNTLEKTRSGTETILIIEDDDTLRLLAMEILQAHGYIPLQAIDGDDGIRVFTENRDKIDLVLLDVVMPKKMDGKSMKH